jgi:cell division protein FtsW
MSRQLSFDRMIFGSAILLVIVGLVMIYSASAIIAMQKTGGANPYYFFSRQCLWLGAGAILMLLVMRIDHERLRDPRLIGLLLGGVIVALVLVLFQPTINGTRRWFSLGTASFQPAEFAKPVMVLFLASYLARREEKINELLSTLLPLLGGIAVVSGLILVQPDFGTALTIAFVCAALIFVAGLSWGRIALFSMALVPALSVILLSAEYRRDRLLVFLNPEADPLGKGFQAMQSLIALGTGGMTGLGIGNGRQKLFYLPEPHTDFIFSIIGEELGFVGALLLLGLFAFLCWRGLRIVQRTTDRFTFYAALGCTLLLGVQALINASVALCLLPTKGLPMPLVSYGGSSLVASLVSVGLLLNFSQRTN